MNTNQTPPPDSLGSPSCCASSEPEWKPDYTKTPRRIVCAAIKQMAGPNEIPASKEPQKADCPSATCSAWIVAGITLPPVGKWVLTHGSYGYVVACCESDGKWQAQYVDHENGEPWLRGDGGEPDYWMHLPSPPNNQILPQAANEQDHGK